MQEWAKKWKILSWKIMNYWPLSITIENIKKKQKLQIFILCRNALNIVNDDLKNRVDELTGEVDILREERNKLRTKVQDLEEELKKTKEQVKQQSEY